MLKKYICFSVILLASCTQAPDTVVSQNGTLQFTLQTDKSHYSEYDTTMTNFRITVEGIKEQQSSVLDNGIVKIDVSPITSDRVIINLGEILGSAGLVDPESYAAY